MDLDTYLTLPKDPATWLVKPLIPAGGAGLLYSPPKVGKSALAVQMAYAVSGGADNFMGFPIVKHGKVLYLQLDTPRTTWTMRWEALRKHGLQFDSKRLLLADRESLEFYPFDILQPAHARYLQQIVQVHEPTLVIVDTMRKLHTGDENSSTVMSNVMTNLVGACHPAAVLCISHDKKPNPEVEKDIMADHRGSTSVVGEMDAILRLTKTRLYYAGRSIEEGSIKLLRSECEETLLWTPDPDEFRAAIESVLERKDLTSMRQRARELAKLISKSEEASMSILRRASLKPATQPRLVVSKPIADVRRQALV